MNTNEIQTELNTLAAHDGGVLQLLSNQVYEVESTLKIPSNVNVIGGFNTVFQPTVSTDNMILLMNVVNSTLSGFSIISNGAKIKLSTYICVYGRCAKDTIKDINMIGDDAGAINIGLLVQTDNRDPNNILIANHNTITGNVTTKLNLGCYAEGIDLCKFSNNDFSYANENYWKNSGMIIGNSTNCTISHNYFNHNLGQGIYLSGCRNCAIESNIVQYNQNSGIHVRFFGDPSNPVKDQYNRYVGNDCSYNGTLNHCHGIHFQEHVSYNTITGNTCCNNSADGIRLQFASCENNVVTGNVCTGNPDTAIECEGENLVEHNILR